MGSLSDHQQAERQARTIAVSVNHINDKLVETDYGGTGRILPSPQVLRPQSPKLPLLSLWTQSKWQERIKVPTNIESGYGKLVGVEEMSAGLKKQTQWNGYAAACTGVAASLQAAATMVT
jgi:hypothetical protein